MANRAIFLDRDGTVIIDKGYLYKISDLEFIPGSIQALKALNDAGFKLLIISNQSGIARGMYTEEDYQSLTEAMLEQLSNRGVCIEDTYYCPHLPDAIVPQYRQVCDCRKPATGLFHRAVKEHDIDLDSSFAIGDRLRDLAICSESDCQGILIGTTEDENVITSARTGVYPNITYEPDLLSAARSILG